MFPRVYICDLFSAACLDHELRFGQVARPWCRAMSEPAAYQGRTHLVPKELEPCPISNCKGYSLQVRTECSEPPAPDLKHLFKRTHSYHLSYWGRRKRHDTRNWKKAISVVVHCLEKHQAAGHSPKGCSSWLWECCRDLYKDNIRATTETRFKTLTIKLW